MYAHFLSLLYLVLYVTALNHFIIIKDIREDRGEERGPSLNTEPLQDHQSSILFLYDLNI